MSSQALRLHSAEVLRQFPAVFLGSGEEEGGVFF